MRVLQNKLNSFFVEDEFHFIMIYPLYCGKREEMSPLTENKYPKVSQPSLKDKFVWLISQEDIEID